jgi:hypothetical protein
MLSLNYENINYVMTQILRLSCVSFSYVSISYVLAATNDVFFTTWWNFEMMIHATSLEKKTSLG